MHRFNGFLLPVFLISLSSTLFGQLPLVFFELSGGVNRGIFQGYVSVRLPLPPIQLMAGAPFSGQQENLAFQVMQDGSRAGRGARLGQKCWRDAQGRIRVEVYFGGGAKPVRGLPTLVEIQDPVAEYIYIMDDLHKVAHRVKASVIPQPNMEQLMTRDVPAKRAAPQGAAQQAGIDYALGPSISFEDLGAQLVNGVLVHGTRVITVPPNGAIGNNPSRLSTRDLWYSPELNMIVSTVISMPREISIERVANLKRDQPDPSLFVVPGKYKMVDETSSFEITWGK